MKNQNNLSVILAIAALVIFTSWLLCSYNKVNREITISNNGTSYDNRTDEEIKEDEKLIKLTDDRDSV